MSTELEGQGFTVRFTWSSVIRVSTTRRGDGYPLHPNGATWHGKRWEAEHLACVAHENGAEDLLADQRALDGLREMRWNLWRRRPGLVVRPVWTQELAELFNPAIHGPGWGELTD
jgi:hypothetical protein